MKKLNFFLPFVFLFLFIINSNAQYLTSVDTLYFKAMHYRCIGPFRGGRSAAVTGVENQPNVFYFGSTGGGVWKTTNGGETWKNVSDGFFGGSIGAIAVSEWDPNVVYVGGGEETLRGNVSHGYGMWKSTDAGKTWRNIGLNDSRHITRIRIHPKNSNLVYVSALGHLFGSNSQRGIFRSKDGGKTWEKILFVNNSVGAVDLALDPVNPRILYASTWKVKRTPYSFESGGKGSALWKSTDGGDTWKKISVNRGFPKGVLGIITIAVSPVNHNRLFSMVEAKNGGLFRSENGGKTWFRVNSEHKLRQRAWYFSRVYADSKDPDVVYVLNVRFWKSKDGGKSFKAIKTPHGDHHDLWIAKNDPLRMIVGDDGGAQISVDGGKSWSTYHNQPTAQFYRVTTDNHFPYRIYGAQQDNSSVRILSRSNGYAITEKDWEATAGGESGWIAPDPKNNDIVYGGSYGGYITKYNHKTGIVRAVNPWPDNPMGHGAKDLKYRFQWNFPIFFSEHDPNALYAAANVLFKTTNGGESWEQISPDLTRHDTTKLGASGGPITKDNTSVEYYCTIFTAAESHFDKNVIWTGSDDGLIYLTKDGGKHWQNVTPPKDILPEWSQINSIEANPFEPGGLYVAATRYKLDDFKPYLLKTTDFGKNWKKITRGIQANHFTRVVRADAGRKGLLFAGTESGMYISFDDGEHWQTFQLNLPIVPITDLAIKNNDLIVATQGRSFWILDDLTPLYQLNEKTISGNYLFKPRAAYRMRGKGGFKSLTAGENPPNGVVFNYFFKNKPDSQKVKLVILDSKGKEIRTFKGNAKKKSERIKTEKGMNQFVWNERYPNAEKFKGLILWGGTLAGPKAVPGVYSAKLIAGKDTLTQQFEIKKDPRSKATIADIKKQFDFLIELRDELTKIHKTIKKIRSIRSEIKAELAKAKKTGKKESEVVKLGRELLKNLTKIENNLYQTKNKSPQDPLNFPIKLNNRIAALASLNSMSDGKPTKQSYEVKAELFKLANAELRKFNKIVKKEIPQFNKAVKKANVPAVIVD